MEGAVVGIENRDVGVAGGRVVGGIVAGGRVAGVVRAWVVAVVVAAGRVPGVGGNGARVVVTATGAVVGGGTVCGPLTALATAPSPTSETVPARAQPANVCGKWRNRRPVPSA